MLVALGALLVLAMPQPQAVAAPAQSPTFINARFADRPVMPTHFSPSDISFRNNFFRYDNYVRDVTWTSWGGSTAEGAGRVSLLHESGDGATSPVTVVLGGRKRCMGIRVYTRYSLTLAPGAEQPKGWPKGQSGEFACSIELPGGYHGERLGRYSNCINGLYQPTHGREGSNVYARWRPRPPDGYWLLCEMHFKGWGGSRAIGFGTVRRAGDVKGRFEWPIRAELSQPIWCPMASGSGSALTYGTLKVFLRSKQLGNAGGKARYVQRIKASVSLCHSNDPERDIYGNPLAAFSSAGRSPAICPRSPAKRGCSPSSGRDQRRGSDEAARQRAGAAPTSIYINAKYADRPVMPTNFSPNYIDDIADYQFTDYVRDIAWTGWGGDTAEGTGRISLLHEPRDGATSPVVVMLSGLERCAGILVYTRYSLTVAPGAEQPRGWPKGRTGTFPCSIALPGGYRGQRLGRKSSCIYGVFQPVGGPANRTWPVARWQPRPPDGYWPLCQMRFKHWGGPRAIGFGTARRVRKVEGQHEWRVQAEFRRPIWCPAASAGYGGAVTYGSVEITLHGGGLANAGDERRYTQRIRVGKRQCQLVSPEPFGRTG